MIAWPRARALAPFVLAGLVAACAQAPLAPDPVPVVAPVVAVDSTREDALRRHRELAAAARAAGDLALAQDHLQVVALLDPANAAIRNDLATLQADIGRRLGEHHEAARAALRAGDTARATSEYLRALALAPRDADAARGLREIDRQSMARAQSGRAARVRVEELVGERGAARAALGAAAATDPRDAYDLDIRLELLRAGDTTSALRELKAWVDAHPRDRTARQRIGAAVAERAKEAENRGQGAQALALYEQALALRGEPMPEWSARIAALRKHASGDFYAEGVKLMRTDLAGAIGKFEAALKADPQHTLAAARLREAKAMQDKLSKVPAK
jgi:tetratricopeptide (TPR) repeat protein